MENSEYQELGHTVIKENGVQCKCGKKGCFERYGSILVFKNKIIERLGLSYDISGPDLRKEIKNNLEKVKDIIEEYLNDLVIGLTMLINKFNPDIVVIGGGFTRYEYMLFEPLKEKLYKSEELIFKNVKIQTAKSGNDAGIIGASFIKD
jgi:predicted NBD/HSP70 family sugar kinase